MATTSARDDRLRRRWGRSAASYERATAYAERRYLAASRPWLCGRATGATLEVAVGTGLNLPHYARDVALSGIEWSEPMLDVARRRAQTLEVRADLRVGDARDLPWPDASFDTVVSTYSLCSIPDPDAALQEMSRVLRPGGLLLLADHVESSSWPVRALQRLADVVSVPLQGERWAHRPLRAVERLGYTIEAHEREHLGLVERFAARRPEANGSGAAEARDGVVGLGQEGLLAEHVDLEEHAVALVERAGGHPRGRT